MPENINREQVLANALTWPTLPLSLRFALPSTAAVYCVLSISDEVLYVGRARSLHRRWRNHHQLAQLKKFEDVRLVWCDYIEPCGIGRDEWLDVNEKEFIRLFDPPLNKAFQDMNDD